MLFHPHPFFSRQKRYLKKCAAANADAGVHVNQITEMVTQQGYTAGDIKMAINNLSNEGHIYSTVDENNYQYAE